MIKHMHQDMYTIQDYSLRYNHKYARKISEKIDNKNRSKKKARYRRLLSIVQLIPDPVVAKFLLQGNTPS